MLLTTHYDCEPLMRALINHEVKKISMCMSVSIYYTQASPKNGNCRRGQGADPCRAPNDQTVTTHKTHHIIFVLWFFKGFFFCSVWFLLFRYLRRVRLRFQFVVTTLFVLMLLHAGNVQ